MTTSGIHETDLFSKLLEILKKAGSKIALLALTLYYCMLDPRTPTWAKSLIAGALAYAILPMDAVPDFLPFVGLVDDAAALTTAVGAVSAHIEPEHEERARLKFEQLFS